MIIIRMNRKLLIIAIIITIFTCFGFNIYSYYFKTLKASTNQFDKSNLFSFIALADNSVQRHENVEIFDIVKGEVIQKVKSNSAIQKESQGYLNGITSMYVKVKAFPDKGYIIRVPMESHTNVKNHWLNDYGINSVDEIFILFPEEGKPYLLVIDEKKRPLFYNFEGNTDVLLKKLNFSIE